MLIAALIGGTIAGLIASALAIVGAAYAGRRTAAALDAGFAAFVRKPVEPQELADAVISALRV